MLPLLASRIAAMRRPPAAAAANLEYVGGVSGEAAAATTPYSIPLTALTGGLASAPASGDTVIVTYGSGSTNGAGDLVLGVSTAGYQEIVSLYAEDTYRTNYYAAWKRMGPTPDTSVSILRPTANAAYTFAVHVWRGADSVTPMDVAPVPSQSTSGGQPDLAIITPVTPGAVILGGAAVAAEPNASAAVLTSDLDNFITHRMTTSTFTWRLIGLGSAAWPGGAYDPTQWGGGSTNVGASWCGVTMALRPGGAVDPPPPNTELTHVGGKAFTFAATLTADVESLTDLTGGVAAAPGSGDYVVVAYGVETGTNRRPILTITGNNAGAYDVLVGPVVGDATNDTVLYVFGKRMGATPDTQITYSGTGDALDSGAISVHVWRGVDATTPIDVPPTTAGGQPARPDPPAITPVTEGAVILAIGAAKNNTAFVAPYLLNFVQAFDPAVYVGSGMGNVAWTGGAYDPAAWTGGYGSATFAAVSLALRPA